jgi:hypothetical protein
VVTKLQNKSSTQSGASTSSTASDSQSIDTDLVIRSVQRILQPPVIERGIAFFLHHFVFAEQQQSGPWSRGNHEYLPVMLKPKSGANYGFQALEIITAAAGIAALANSSSAQDLIPQAYTLYGEALRKVRIALQDPEQAISDETLAAVMLMGTFEVASPLFGRVILMIDRPLLLQTRNLCSHMVCIPSRQGD